MKLLNYRYKDRDSLKKFIQKNSILDTNFTFIQLFYSDSDIKNVYKARDDLNSILPNASFMATSTAGIVKGGEIVDGEIVISFSLFEHSFTKSLCYVSKTADEIVESISKDLITSSTKLLVIFANTFKINSEYILKEISLKHPNIVISGGNAGDDFKFKTSNVFSSKCNTCDVVVGVIYSDILKVETKYLFNWQTIGKQMVVTKSSENIVYEINNQSVLDIYKHYLGDEIAENMHTLGIEFPLIFSEDGVDVARAPIAVDEAQGSVQFAGDIKEGSYVKFGYANIENIKNANIETINQNRFKNEAIYIYSCATRRQVLGSYFKEELKSLHTLAPLSGFATYGEFFHDSKSCSNNLLNITTTYVVLNEGNKEEIIEQKRVDRNKNIEEIRLKAITTLVAKIGEELDENLYYLEQFKRIVNNFSIISATDEKGIIKDVNENFISLSGYSKEELIGKSHNIVRHEDMPKEVYRDMWETIKSGKSWRGLVKNKTKEGKPYYVISEISEVLNKDGSFKEYLGFRTDITELEEYKNILRVELDIKSNNLEDNLHYMQQYENIINSSIAILKTDTKSIIKYANKKFCDLSGYTEDELVGKNCSELRHQKHRESHLCDKITEKLSKKESVQYILTNIAKDGSEYIIDSLFYPLLNRNNEVSEYIQVMLDVTEIYALNEEIINTQREVVLTMGAIGETRSKETGLHVKRVAEYSYLLAKLAGISEEEASLLKQASPMHDIGKVGISDNILNKPAKLTLEEFEVMKTHAIIGYEMLQHSKRPILRASAQVALTHHEKYDGSGYPRGLKAENIPIYGRITAIADVFDALGHDRCYKKAWELDKILELFEKERAKHFDPNLIDLFFKNLDKFLEIRDRLQDNVLI
ncbi:MAG: PAS domain S-box protein [Sulfurimonas sp.]|uniref:PAS domain S-box protein n=1 Tax=Sulfurimonas sp. TaxID=2022749 RepID=UPI00261A9D2D|nr:PAS domain S-box protein [Sulfurimonas sp.]MDD5400969.1 PAS domain S-box protein [Sulfurimonas sp.]